MVARRFSKGFQVIICIIGSLVGLILLLFVLGLITDWFTHPSIERAGKEALKDLMSLKRDEPGNAWNYYSAAIEKYKDIKPDKIPYRYLEGKIEITPNVIKIIEESKDIIGIIKEGTKQDFCSIPYNYEKGVAADIPDFMSLRRTTDIICAKSLSELEMGHTEEALDNIFSVATVGKDIAAGAPVLISQMIGTVIFLQVNHVLEIGIASGVFNSSELETISEFLDEIERFWPMLSTALDGETKSLKITLSQSYRNFETSLPVWWSNIKIRFYAEFAARFFCWRYIFSPKRATLCSIRLMDSIINELKEMESETVKMTIKEETDIKAIDLLKKRMNNYAAKNHIFSVLMPNIIPVYRRILRTITKIRMLYLSSIISSYRLEKGRFPLNLEEIAEDLVVDFNTGKMWEYTNYEDSVTIFSPGPDISDRKDDISITLTRMGIKKYLAKRRKSHSK